jgi:prolyl-tRNA synthetase
MLAEATDHLDRNTVAAASIEEAIEAAATGFAVIPWAAVGVDAEARLAESAVTVRCLRRPDRALALSEDEPDLVAVVGRAY